jgi:hypothetical protein
MYNSLSNLSQVLTSHLDKIENNVYTNNWDIIEAEFKVINQKWKKELKLLTLVLDHQELEKINLSLMKFKGYIEIKNKPLALGESSNLKYLINHIREKESLSLDNIF